MKDFDYLENLHEAILVAYDKFQQEPTDDNAYEWDCTIKMFENALCGVELTEEESEIVNEWYEK